MPCFTVGAVAYLAESANHHPDVAISWNKVTLTLSTHSAGGLTADDFALARQISALSKGPPPSGRASSGWPACFHLNLHGDIS